mgnify:CR=1 FL=1
MRCENKDDQKQLLRIQKKLKREYKVLDNILHELYESDTYKYRKVKESMIKLILEIEELKIRGLINEF